MSDLRKAAQQALEALESDWDYRQAQAITALRAALAQPEPVIPPEIKGNKTLTDDSVREEAYRRCNAGWALMCKKMVAAEREAFVAIINDNTDGDGICCADDLLAAIRARGSHGIGGEG